MHKTLSCSCSCWEEINAALFEVGNLSGPLHWLTPLVIGRPPVIVGQPLSVTFFLFLFFLLLINSFPLGHFLEEVLDGQMDLFLLAYFWKWLDIQWNSFLFLSTFYKKFWSICCTLFQAILEHMLNSLSLSMWQSMSMSMPSMSKHPW